MFPFVPLTPPLSTHLCAGNVKDIMTTAFGWAYFGGFAATSMSVGGLFLSFLGAFLFGAVSLRRSQRAAAKVVEDAAMAKVSIIGTDASLQASSIVLDSSLLGVEAAAGPDGDNINASTQLGKLGTAISRASVTLDSTAGIDDNDEEVAIVTSKRDYKRSLQISLPSHRLLLRLLTNALYRHNR